MLDKSEARVEVVDIDRTYMQTHAIIFRQYIIEYHFPGKSKKHKFLASYPHLTYFIERKGAIIAVHKGAFVMAMGQENSSIYNLDLTLKKDKLYENEMSIIIFADSFISNFFA